MFTVHDDRIPNSDPSFDDLPMVSGIHSVWGFLSKFEPHALRSMLDPVAGLLPDQDRALRLAIESDTPTFILRPPSAVALVGIRFVYGFPLRVLERVFPISP